MATSDPKTPAALNAAPPATGNPVLSKVEASKRRAAYKAVEDHFDPSYRYIGIGSGSTVVYVVEAIAAKGRNVTSKMIFIPTGAYPLNPSRSETNMLHRRSGECSRDVSKTKASNTAQSKQLIIEAGLPLGAVDSLPPVEVGHNKLSAEQALKVSVGLQDLGLKGKREAIDVAFDGADEIDEELNCIKGGGACLFQEKLVATSAKKFICVAGEFFTFCLVESV